MSRVFNLKKYVKTAFYDDDRGLWNNQSRAWMNCYKANLDKGLGAQESWDKCLSSYQTSNKKADWTLQYSSVGKKK